MEDIVKLDPASLQIDHEKNYQVLHFMEYFKILSPENQEKVLLIVQGMLLTKSEN